MFIEWEIPKRNEAPVFLISGAICENLMQNRISKIEEVDKY